MQERAAIKVRERLRLIHSYAALLPALSRNAAARQLGASRTTLDRYYRCFLAGGPNALAPRFHQSGRRPVLEFGDIPAVTIEAVRALAVQLGDVERAWREHARTPECPPRIAEWFRSHRRVPAALIKALGLRRHVVTIWTGPNDFLAFNPPTSLAA